MTTELKPDTQLISNLVVTRPDGMVLFVKYDQEDERWWLPGEDLEPYEHPDERARIELARFGLEADSMEMSSVESFAAAADGTWSSTIRYRSKANPLVRSRLAGSHPMSCHGRCTVAGSTTPSSESLPRGIDLPRPDSQKTCRRYPDLMCRNIRTLHNFEPPASNDEVADAALQFVRKISGFTRPSRANEQAFQEALASVTEATRTLVNSLVASSPPKDREIEATKARARSAQRYAS